MERWTCYLQPDSVYACLLWLHFISAHWAKAYYIATLATLSHYSRGLNWSSASRLANASSPSFSNSTLVATSTTREAGLNLRGQKRGIRSLRSTSQFMPLSRRIDLYCPSQIWFDPSRDSTRSMRPRVFWRTRCMSCGHGFRRPRAKGC